MVVPSHCCQLEPAARHPVVKPGRLALGKSVRAPEPGVNTQLAAGVPSLAAVQAAASAVAAAQAALAPLALTHVAVVHVLSGPCVSLTVAAESEPLELPDVLLPLFLYTQLPELEVM